MATPAPITIAGRMAELKIAPVALATQSGVSFSTALRCSAHNRLPRSQAGKERMLAALRLKLSNLGTFVRVAQ